MLTREIEFLSRRHAMRRTLVGTIWVLGLWAGPASLPAQQAACCGQDTARAAGMHTQMQEWDRRLEAKLAEVDRTKGDKKVAAMADAVRELLVQRREMHEHLAKGAAAPGGCPCGGMQGTGHGGHQMPGAGRAGGCPMHGAGGAVGSP
jgi:hypothetical protein